MNKIYILALTLVFSGCANQVEPEIESTKQALTVTGSWDNLPTEVWGYNGVACLARALFGRVLRSGTGYGQTHFVFSPWLSGEVLVGTTDEETIQAIVDGRETFLAEYSLISISARFQTIRYLSSGGKQSWCLVDKQLGRGTWTGEF